MTEHIRTSKPKPQPLLTIEDLAVSFDIGLRERVRAVDGLSLTIHPTQTLALVGESGCGKSVTALSVLGLVPSPPGRVEGGAVRLGDRDLLALTRRERREVRGGEVAMIFQEPEASLNPVYTIGAQMIEAIRLHQRVGRHRAREIAIEAMRDVGMIDPDRCLRAYPHEFSGGMCQRAMTAIALACRPKLLLADEPTTALDVTIQAQILDLLDQLKRDRGMSIMLITHDLGVVAQMADVVCVMYAGRAVEYATVEVLFDRPFHPYTRGLFGSIPNFQSRQHRLPTVAETVADPAAFKRLPGASYGLIPWWPEAPVPDELDASARSRGGKSPDVALVEVEPEHWVACWRTEYVAAHPTSRPDLDWRRPAPSVDRPPANVQTPRT